MNPEAEVLRQTPRIEMENCMTNTTIAKRITALEQELQRMELRLKKHAARHKKPPFTGLRGLWKSCGDISYEEIGKAEIRLDDNA